MLLFWSLIRGDNAHDFSHENFSQLFIWNQWKMTSGFNKSPFQMSLWHWPQKLLKNVRKEVNKWTSRPHSTGPRSLSGLIIISVVFGYSVQSGPQVFNIRNKVQTMHHLWCKIPRHATTSYFSHSKSFFINLIPCFHRVIKAPFPLFPLKKASRESPPLPLPQVHWLELGFFCSHSRDFQSRPHTGITWELKKPHS